MNIKLSVGLVEIQIEEYQNITLANFKPMEVTKTQEISQQCRCLNTRVQAGDVPLIEMR